MLHIGRFVHEVAEAYDRHIVSPGKQPQVLILVSFLLTFLVARAITWAIRHGHQPRLLRNLVGPGGTHYHHLVPGILLLLVSGYLGIGLAPTYQREPHAIMFGIGAALTLDEFALWLHLEDVYWEERGRKSIDAVIVVTAILALGIVGHGFWLGIGRAVGRLTGLI